MGIFDEHNRKNLNFSSVCKTSQNFFGIQNRIKTNLEQQHLFDQKVQKEVQKSKKVQNQV